jgi:hypothetical protein
MHPSYVEPKGCHFLFYGVIRKSVNCCVCSGWFPVYVYFKFSVSSCFCQIEEDYGIAFFLCGVKKFGLHLPSKSQRSEKLQICSNTQI